MSNVPFIPETAPFSVAQRAWLNGFLAGMYSGGTTPDEAAPAVAKKTVNVYFGSESGNAEALSKQIAKAAQKRGFASKAIGLDKVKLNDLAAAPVALIVTSTFGDGEPPSNAADFKEALFADGVPSLSNLRYSVLALGDMNYEKFCQFGMDVDARLAELGASRLYERVDCDVAYEAAASAWQEGVFSVIDAEVNAVAAVPPLNGVAETPAGGGYSKKNPFPATLLTNRKLTADDSAKETRHYEISLAGSGLSYEVGDALGVVSTNCPALVDDILRALNRDGEEAVPTPDGGEASLRTALLRHYEITKVPASLLKVIAERSSDKTLVELMIPEAKEALAKYLWGREIIDLLGDFASVTFEPADFVSHLRKLQPRLYSISSSLHAFPDQVHLTVASVRYESFGRKRKGVCSTFLADRANGQVPVFTHVAKGFRLPASGDTPIIMVGPGTGIAPFRAFLHDRKAKGAKGRNWLFFGDQKASTDFLYREELDVMLAEGHLTRLSTAFSRDQTEKIYVQHRMLEAAGELWAWLEDGAHFYVCGDASRMAKDVDAALHKVIETAGGRSADEAAEYVSQLKSAKRYQRDVY
jgi:sulfite reductase (NADPH) flavoprotein alpha-component